MTKEMPTCKKCSLQHWGFEPCDKGKKYVRVGYNTIQRESEYSPPRNKQTGYESMFRRTAYKQTHQTDRVHYLEEERDG